jgi:hypothetical protein
MQPEREDLLALMLEQGGRRQAVWLYQEETGANPEEARHAVREFALRRGLDEKAGVRWPLWGLALLAISVAVALAIAH